MSSAFFGGSQLTWQLSGVIFEMIGFDGANGTSTNISISNFVFYSLLLSSGHSNCK